MPLSTLQILLLILFSLQLQAKVYRPVLKSGSSTGVTFSIPYTAGTHDGFSSQIDGLVETDDNDQLIRAQFMVPIVSLSTSNKTRDCHMLEALGLDYRASRFPEKHVCNSQDKLPSSGPDSIVYPSIAFQFQSFTQLPAVPLKAGVPTSARVKAVMQIHGVTRQLNSLPLQITKSVVRGQTFLRVQTRFQLSLQDYQIVVKPVKIGPFSFGVDDTVSVSLDLTLKELI
jgi:hypothetical protein